MKITSMSAADMFFHYEEHEHCHLFWVIVTEICSHCNMSTKGINQSPTNALYYLRLICEFTDLFKNKTYICEPLSFFFVNKNK